MAAAEWDGCLTARLRRILRSVPARCATTCARIAVDPPPPLWNWNFRGPFGVNPTVCGDWSGRHQEQIRAYLDAQHRKMVDEMTEYMMRPLSPWDAPQPVIPRIPPQIVPDPGIPPGKAYQVVATGVIYANPDDLKRIEDAEKAR